MDARQRDAKKLAQEFGLTLHVARRGGHFHLRDPKTDALIYVMPGSSSCRHSLKNARADLSRITRQTPKGSQE